MSQRLGGAQVTEFDGSVTYTSGSGNGAAERAASEPMSAASNSQPDPADIERVRRTVYRHLAESGAALSVEAIAESIGMSAEGVTTALARLAEDRHLVLVDGEIELAHPFATRSFGFSVMGPDTLWWGGCAWDAFAIPNLVPGAPEVLVATTCPECAAPHAWTVTNRAAPLGDQVAHFLTPMDRIWPDAAHACDHQAIFCDESCVTAWLTRTGNERGAVLTLAQLWDLAAHWYEGRLDSPYSRREPAEASAYFRSVGLSGSFWGLGDPTE